MDVPCRLLLFVASSSRPSCPSRLLLSLSWLLASSFCLVFLCVILPSLLRRLFLSSTFSNVLPPSLVLGPSRLPFSCILLDHLLTSLVASFPPRLDSLSVPFSLLVSSSCVLVVRFLSPLMYSSSCVLSPCLVWCPLSVSPLIFVYRFLVCPLCSSVH